MTFSAKKNDGVSPVIGTILLVAITVVLVAIISAVVMGMAGGIGSSYVVGVTVTEDSSAIAGTALITITGGNDASKLEKLYVYNATGMNSSALTTVGVPNSIFIGVGSQVISVVGNFADGTNQTIYTATVNY